MIDRILLILKAKNLTSSQFADRLGVQRSNISHILSGRNKPSLDFIIKIKNSFPKISTDWLVFGKGEMFTDVSNDKPVKDSFFETPKIDLFSSDEKENYSNKTDIEDENVLQKEIKTPENNVLPSEDKKNQKSDKVVDNERNSSADMIVIFYKDKTYKEYYPNN